MAPEPDKPIAQISLADFVEATTEAVLRALETRAAATRGEADDGGFGFPFGPIVCGIICYPTGVLGIPGVLPGAVGAGIGLTPSGQPEQST